MKHLLALVNLLFLTTLLNSSLFAQSETSTDSLSTISGNLIVKITNINSDKGKMSIGIYDTEENYDESNLFSGVITKIENGSVNVTIPNIPFGTYAIKCFHDENGNGKLDTNFLGIPSEGYCFSNNAVGNFGPASFEDAKFEFISDKQIVEMEIQ